MKKRIFIILLVSLMAVMLIACKKDEDEGKETIDDEVLFLEVDFEVPETAEVDEVVTLKATVTYGNELVKDAKELNFEYWLGDDKDNSTKVDGENHNDGTYTLDVAFPEDGIYSIYAHTTAKGMHTMPLKKIAVGEVDEHEADEDAHHEHGTTEGFNLHFEKPEAVKANEAIDLVVHLQMDETPLEKANVRYEIMSDQGTDWVDAAETVAGEYSGTHTFDQQGTYEIQIHVQDDEDLHEHEHYEIEVQ